VFFAASPERKHKASVVAAILEPLTMAYGRKAHAEFFTALISPGSAMMIYFFVLPVA
jgi:hypothetical protein